MLIRNNDGAIIGEMNVSITQEGTPPQRRPSVSVMINAPVLRNPLPPRLSDSGRYADLWGLMLCPPAVLT